MMNRRELGNLGEEQVAGYLRRKGWEILERNYRFAGREIDIIAREGDVIVFIEVKKRNQSRWGRGAEAVDYRKRRRIAGAASHYLAANSLTEVNVRFDVASLDGGSLEYIEDAFQAD
jgi:putative endonuclease